MNMVDYRDKFGTYNFHPFADETDSKILYLKLRWWGCTAVRITDYYGNTIWETPAKVIHTIDNPFPTDDLPF